MGLKLPKFHQNSLDFAKSNMQFSSNFPAHQNTVQTSRDPRELEHKNGIAKSAL